MNDRLTQKQLAARMAKIATTEKKPAKRTAKAVTIQRPLVNLCRAAGLPVPVPEYVFAHPRRWRFDYCFPDQMIAVEIEGGVFTGGRHSRGAGFLADMEKYNAAGKLGYRVFRYLPRQMNLALADLMEILR